MNSKQFYDTKKASAANRNLDFNFTEAQFKRLYNTRFTNKCAYTKQTFVTDKEHSNYPTLERIDESKPYSIENCVWVTARVNLLKAKYIEIKGDVSELTTYEQTTVNSIKKILNSPETLAERQKPYLKLKTSLAEENILMSKVMTRKQKQLREVKTTGMYSEFGDTIINPL
jgi:hypothetical protein